MTRVWACLAIHVALSALVVAPAHAVPPTGRYVYLLRPSVRIQEADTPSKALHRAAAAFWGGNARIPEVLAANGMADESQLKFGTVLRVPAPSQASAISRCFELGLRLEVDMKGHPTVRVDCDPCSTPAGDGDPALALRVTDGSGRTLGVPLESVPGADSGAGSTGSAVTDLRAWNLPHGEVLIVVRSRSAPAGAGRGFAGGIAFYRLSPGPRAVLLTSLPGDQGVAGVGGSSHDDCTLSAELEGGSFVLTVTRMHYDQGTARQPDQSIVRHSTEAEFRQRLTYDASHHALNVGPSVEIARRHKSWAEDEPEPTAFTEDPVLD